MPSGITKTEAAQRQLDTAIDLWFQDRDGLSAFALAFASLKVLFDVYPHKSSDGFDDILDKVIGEVGWKSLSRNANFLKHADRDPHALLSQFHPDMGMPVIGLATLLYKRVVGTLSVKMKALDSWVEMTGADELEIEEVDANAKRAESNRRIREALKGAPRGDYMKFAGEYYEFFLKNHDRLEEEVNQALVSGMSFQEALDQKFDELRQPNSPPGRSSSG